MASAGGSENKCVQHHLVDDFESTFQNCISLLTSQEHFNVQDSEETRGGVENGVQRFLESARQMETFFLNKRLILSVAKPENVLSEDMIELKAELERKETLLEKHYDKIAKWQTLLRASTIPPTSSAATTQQQSSPYAGSQSTASMSGGGHPSMGGSVVSSSIPASVSSASMHQSAPSGYNIPGSSVPVHHPHSPQVMSQQHIPPGLTPGQYPGPPAGHPGQYMPPPAYPQQGPLAYLERMGT